MSARDRSKTEKPAGKSPPAVDEERPSAGEPDDDRLLVHGFSEGGKVAHVIRSRRKRIEAGVLRPVEEGKPLAGDLVQLRRRPEFPLLFDVEEKVTSPLRPTQEGRRKRPGPPQVASKAFLKGWEAIWGLLPDPKEDDRPN